ncbi:MAG TPA: hypothetical protein VHB21_12410 [Minicystis sp.]|nr:hypothetical protein [Minicystis sp.]
MGRTSRFALVAASLLATACSQKPPATSLDTSAPSGPPARLPAYTPKQLALLAPIEQPIEVPASRVLPDLRRFGHAPTHRSRTSRSRSSSRR